MDVPVLLIADSNPEFRHALAQALKRCYCVHCCGTGTEALRLLRALRPEILVLDLTIPEVDGLTLLQMAVSEGLRPRVLAITPLVSNYILESADEPGVGYMMRQPCDARLVVRQVNEPPQMSSGLRGGCPGLCCGFAADIGTGRQAERDALHPGRRDCCGPKPGPVGDQGACIRR